MHVKNTRLNSIYHTMIARYCNPKHERYKEYGAKGITVCEEWLNNEIVMGVRPVSKGWLNFKEWALSNGYNDTLTIDRIDNSKGYSPENCRWATPKRQANNRTNNRVYTIFGRTQTLAQWCNELGKRYDTTWKRLKSGWSIEKALDLGGTQNS